ncbi:unnamed protein product, partial [Prorocentrum cordatum]
DLSPAHVVCYENYWLEEPAHLPPEVQRFCERRLPSAAPRPPPPRGSRGGGAGECSPPEALLVDSGIAWTSRRFQETADGHELRWSVVSSSTPPKDYCTTPSGFNDSCAFVWEEAEKAVDEAAESDCPGADESPPSGAPSPRHGTTPQRRSRLAPPEAPQRHARCVVLLIEMELMGLSPDARCVAATEERLTLRAWLQRQDRTFSDAADVFGSLILSVRSHELRRAAMLPAPALLLPSGSGWPRCWPGAGWNASAERWQDDRAERDFCCALPPATAAAWTADHARCFPEGRQRKVNLCCGAGQGYVFDGPDCWPAEFSPLQREGGKSCCRWAKAGGRDATGAPPGCFDDFRTPSLCCRQTMSVGPSEDSRCPWRRTERWADRVLSEPSRAAPFVLLRDQKVGGQTLMLWLQAALLRLGKISASQVWPPIHGVPFFLKKYADDRGSLEVVSGIYDWRVLVDGIHCEQRDKVHGLLLLRHPVDRFLSFYRERSNRAWERRLGREMRHWTVAELRAYLRSASQREFDGNEPGVFCDDFLGGCLTASTAMRPLRAARRNWSWRRESKYFRACGGPFDSLTWLLDPEHGEVETAIARMRRLVVGLLVERFDEWREVAAFFFPWLHEPRSGDGPLAVQSTHEGPRQARVRRRYELAPALREELARWNARDMAVYAAGTRPRARFDEQLAFARQRRGAAAARPAEDRWPSAGALEGAWQRAFRRERPKHAMWADIRT